MAKKQIINTAEAMLITGLAERSIQKLCKEGKLRAEKIGRDWLIEKTSANEYFKLRIKREKERLRKAAKKAKKAEKAKNQRATKNSKKRPQKAEKQAEKGRK